MLYCAHFGLLILLDSLTRGNRHETRSSVNLYILIDMMKQQSFRARIILIEVEFFKIKIVCDSNASDKAY